MDLQKQTHTHKKRKSLLGIPTSDTIIRKKKKAGHVKACLLSSQNSHIHDHPNRD